MLTAAQVRRACRRTPDADNLNSVMVALERYGPGVGLDLLHREVPYLAQIMHESGEFKFDREVWGPTDAQKRYESRTDLGNTQPGDGYRFRGHGPLQCTGRYNHRDYTGWARKIDPAAPDFEAEPERINTDPWEGLSAIWYWDTRGLNAYADKGDNEMITRRINGGLNGYADRLTCYTRLALVVLGYAPDAVRAWQSDNRLTADGIAGPATRASLHDALVRTDKILPATPPVGSMPVLRRGAKGPDVASLQALLNSAGASLKVDKDFGGRTLDAVLAFQRREHLTADGIVGRNTWAALGVA
ncbi:hypothetical protein GCM10019059_07840 [Camelimonas fluminis]|uniref:Peptidoglycan-binding protein n=1 Tax=Camelimonas fluminis TaxID=1576911 RepID=A0ABV7UET9_9HYPH|nr:peptidoglycan-binding protein [Camelimonas fluminis]GHE51068.1 hypothetical protein GCM10019059_07840 [Camelimonas fluminis]